MWKKWITASVFACVAQLSAQQSEQPGFSYGAGQTQLPVLADELDVAKVRPYDQVLVAKFNKAWFAFREKHTLTDDGLFVPSVNGSELSPDTPESQTAFLHYLSQEPVKVTYRHSVKCEDCRGTGKKYVYEGLSATELTHVICGGTGKMDSLIICRLSYTATPPPRLPSANQRAYLASLKLAEAGQAVAALDVANRLSTGRGVAKDLAVAAKWYEKSMLGGEPKAAGQLSLLYERGEVGFEMNKPFALALSMLGRELGGGDAILNQLARSTAPMDVLKGHWYGQHLLKLKKAGQLTEGSLSPKIVEREVMGRFGEVMAAARRDDRQATFDVGMIQLCGFGAAGIDAPAAFGWFTKAAKAGNPLAYYALGSHYEAGVAVRKNRAAAFALYRVSMSLGQEFPAAQAVKALEPYCTDRALSVKVDELLAKVRAGGVAASDVNGLSALADVDVPVVAAVPTGAPDSLGQEQDTKSRIPIVQSGSGMIFTADGHVFTNHHVIDKCTYFTVKMNGTMVERRAYLVASDPIRDLAILKIYDWQGASEVPYTLPSLLRSAKTEAGLGMRVFTIGFPIPRILNSSPKYTSGDLNSTDGPADCPHFLQVSCPIQPGNSGGPLVLEDGRVAGVICGSLASRALPSQNTNFATRIEYLRELAEKNGVAIPEASARVSNPIQTVQAHAVQVLCRR
jgi:S1-C subfamily serine protease